MAGLERREGSFGEKKDALRVASRDENQDPCLQTVDFVSEDSRETPQPLRGPFHAARLPGCGPGDLVLPREGQGGEPAEDKEEGED